MDYNKYKKLKNVGLELFTDSICLLTRIDVTKLFHITV